MPRTAIAHAIKNKNVPQKVNKFGYKIDFDSLKKEKIKQSDLKSTHSSRLNMSLN